MARAIDASEIVSGSIAERYRAVVDRAGEAAIRSGRDPREVTIVAAAKTFSAAVVQEVISAGAQDIGENYVQEAERISRAVHASAVRWHMIGRLQRNKAAAAVRLFDLVHSLDRVDLAHALDVAAARLGGRIRCLVEVNLGGEPAKGGVGVDDVEALLEQLSELHHLRIAGLMAIPPADITESSRPRFAALRRLRDRMADLRLPNVQLKELSMGMSSDFEAAIEEGATMVRVGSAIFGLRR